MNKDLYGKKWDFPQDMRDHMKVCFQKVNNADANVEGYNRNLRLQKTTSLSYPELKRIKNFFDSFTGPQTDAPFILNGENKMKNFVDSILYGARQSISTTDKIKNDTGMSDMDVKLKSPNQNLNTTKFDSKKNSLEKHGLQVTESLKRINQLMRRI
jgi:hypothetical protein